jgi:hypothetical protein
LTARRTAALCVVYVLAVAGGVVGADRVAANFLFTEPNRYVPAFRSFYHPAVSWKMQQIGDLRQLDVLFIGNSLTMLGVDPDSFDRAAPAAIGRRVSSYNLAVPSVGAGFWPQFFERAYDGPWPRTVALGIQPRDLDPTGESIDQKIGRRFFADEGWRSRSMGATNQWAEQALSRALILYGRRGQGLPALAQRMQGNKTSTIEDIRVEGSEGFGVFGQGFHRSAANLKAGKAAHAAVAKPAPFVFTREARRGLVRLRALLARHGTRLVLFTLPIYYDSEPEGNARTDREFVAAVRRFSRAQSLTFVDAGHRFASRFAVTDYGDENHLDTGGARRFSRLLAPAVLRP